MKKLALLGAVLVAVVALSGCITGSTTKKIDSNSISADAVLQALKDADAKLYVTPETCPHCRKQLEILGPQAGDYITITDCAKVACPNIQYVPTWVINGKTYVGTYELEELAAFAGLEENGVEKKGAEGTTPLE